MTAARTSHLEPDIGCVLSSETGVLVVLTDEGPLRATYGARLLGAVARDRARMPRPGQWVSLHRWSDGPVTVEGSLECGAPERRPRRLRVAALEQ